MMDWEALGAMLGVITVWGGVLLWAVKTLMDRQAKQLATLEADLVALRLELAREYVRREDWIRFGGTIDAKLDRLSERMGNLTEKLYGRD